MIISRKFVIVVPHKLVSEPIMHKLSSQYKVVPNILRGRITNQAARLEIELSGTKKAIEKSCKYLNGVGIVVKKN